VSNRRDNPLRIGLTGGIASGKSTVAGMFADLGVPVIDTDVIAREVVSPGQPALAELEAILHPKIGKATRAQAEAAGGAYQVIVVPLLVESSLRGFVDRVLVVDCDERTQVARLLERDAESEEQARRILAAQSTRAERLAIADDVVSNDGSLDDTGEQVRALHRTYLIEAAARED
jgi:dephospho-CoA kinase